MVSLSVRNSLPGLRGYALWKELVNAVFCLECVLINPRCPTGSRVLNLTCLTSEGHLSG